MEWSHFQGRVWVVITWYDWKEKVSETKWVVITFSSFGARDEMIKMDGWYSLSWTCVGGAWSGQEYCCCAGPCEMLATSTTHPNRSKSPACCQARPARIDISLSCIYQQCKLRAPCSMLHAQRERERSCTYDDDWSRKKVIENKGARRASKQANKGVRSGRRRR